MRQKIRTILKADASIIGRTILVYGWVRSVRRQKSFAFIAITDGSCLSYFQVVAEPKLVTHLSTGAAVVVVGKVVESPGAKQKYEMQAERISIVGTSSSDYPLQKKRHSAEFLRTITHLRPRTRMQGAVARVRSRLAYATHHFFQGRDFIYLHSPIITGNDCEGAGQMFQVTTLDVDSPDREGGGGVDYRKDFFAQPTFLTVSGQLNAEAYSAALSDVYTFGPTFRAENSNTSRHLAEFWMIEPELAFADLSTVASLAETYLKALVTDIIDHCFEDLQFFDRFIENGLIERLNLVKERPFVRITYTEAIQVLASCGRSFKFPVEWGRDLQSEHERFLSEEHCKAPIILTDYPKKIKAFYMRDNDDGQTVAALDLLLPKVGEIIGGSQREERYDVLKNKLVEHHLDLEIYRWYLELRKYGTAPHGGFGLGFERLVQFITGVTNIRDVVAFPRVPGSCEC